MKPEKTIKDNSNERYHELHNLEEFKDIGFNEEESCYISSLNCSTHRAYEDMMDTKKQYNKNITMAKSMINVINSNGFSCNDLI